MSVRAVIGANYGDEGKGLVTDYLVGRRPAGRTLVVRFNGGAQAGHTVQRNGVRHVFKHFGSGTLAGAPTFWSRHCVANPMVFGKERASLLSHMAELPAFYIDLDAPVATFMDMIVNQAAEHHRGQHRHGSCGMGINETVTRAEASPALTIRARDLRSLSEHELRMKLDAIRESWLPLRCAALGIPVPRLAYEASLDDEWLIAADHMGGCAVVTTWPEAARTFSHHVFEGAQGLRLDEKAPGFPHVTRSRTGLTNVVDLAARAGLSDIQPWYVTRWYLTRHGAGPLDQECAARDLSERIVDETNNPNQHQGSLRFAPLNVETFANCVVADVGDAAFVRPIRNVHVVVTCLDQLPYFKQPPVMLSGGATSLGDLARTIGEATGSTVCFAAGSEAANLQESISV